MAANKPIVQLMSAVWERDHEDASVRQQHGAFIWNQDSSLWGYRGRSNPFPRFSIFGDDQFNILIFGYR